MLKHFARNAVSAIRLTVLGRLAVCVLVVVMILAATPVPAAAASVSKIKFTTPARTVEAGVASAVMTIQTQANNGNPVNVGSNTNVVLTSTSGQGVFSLNASPWVNITSVTIAAGTNSKSFYYKDTIAGSPTITAAESPSQGWTDATQQETVQAGPIGKIVFTTSAQTATAGVATSVMTIQTQDAYGNLNNVSVATTINLTSTSGQGVFSLNASPWVNVTSMTIAAGTNSKNFYYKDTVAGSPTITAAESPSQGWTDATQQETIQAAAISKIAFTTSPQTISVGAASTAMTVQTQDTYGNAKNVSANTAINLTSTSAQGVFSLNPSPWVNVTSVTIANGSSSASFNYKDSAIGGPTITAAENPSQGWTDATQQETIVSSVIEKIVFTSATQNITAGTVSGTMTVQTQDAFGTPHNVGADTTFNLMSTSAQGVFSLNATPWVNITSVTITAGASTASFYYKDTATGTPTITTAENPSQGWIDATQQEVVQAAAIGKIAFTTSPQSITTGAASSVMTVQTQDAFNNPRSVSANTNLSLTSTSPQGVFSLNASPWVPVVQVTISSGASTANFYYKDTTPGTPTITAAENPSQGWTDATQQETIIGNSDISKLVFTTLAQNITAGQASYIMTIQTQDSMGTRNVSSNTTINLTSSAIAGVFSLAATPWNNIISATIPAGSNLASFYYKDTTAGTPTVTAAENPSQGWTDATQPETIISGPISKIVFLVSDPTIRASVASSAWPIQLQDAFGNPVNASANMTVRLTSTSPAGRFDTSPTGPFDGSITSVIIPAGSNQATIYYLDTTAGTPTVTAAENPSQGWTDGTLSVTVTGGAIGKIVFTTSPQVVTAGAASGIMTIQTQDPYGNPKTVSSDTVVNLTSTSAQGIFSLSQSPWVNITSVTIANGASSGSFYYKDTVSAAPTLTASENPSLGWTDATQQETINPAVIAKIVFTTPPRTIAAGSASAVIIVQTQDTYNNVSNVSSNVSVNLTSTSGTGRFDSSPGGLFDGSFTSVTINAGGNAANFYYLDTDAGTPTITAAENPSLGWTDATQQETVVGASIINTPPSFGFGLISISSTRDTGLTYFTLTNSSSFNVNVTIRGTDLNGGGGWTLSDNATPGPGVCGIRAGLEGQSYSIIVKKTGPFNFLMSNLSVGSSQRWGLQLVAPTSFSDGEIKSGTITLTATQA